MLKRKRKKEEEEEPANERNEGKKRKQGKERKKRKKECYFLREKEMLLDLKYTLCNIITASLEKLEVFS